MKEPNLTFAWVRDRAGRTCLEVVKKKGKLTVDEIVKCMRQFGFNDYGFALIDSRESEEPEPVGDFVRVYDTEDWRYRDDGA